MDVILHWWIFNLVGAVLYGISDGENIDKHIMEGRHLVIATIHKDPYVLVEHTGTKISRVTGFVPEIVAWMAKKYSFTFEFVESSDGAYGAVENGSWNGVVGMVVRGEVHMVAADLSITHPRSLVVDFTIPFSEEPMSLVIPYPQLESTITRIIKPFKPEVWLGIILSLLIAAFFLWLISQCELRNFPRLYSRRETGGISYIWFLFRVVANPGEVITFTLAARLVVAAWCLTAVVLVNSYTSCLVSYLMAPRYVPLMNTIQDLADSTEISLVVLKHTSVHSALLAATSGALGKLGESLRNHPNYLITSLENINDIIFYQQKEKTPSTLLMDKDFKATKQCRLSFAKEPLLPDQVAFALTKHSPYTSIYNYELIWLRQLGLVNYWKDSLLPRPNRCSSPPSKFRTTANKRLNLNYLSSPFLLYGIGVACSTALFFFELAPSIFWNRPIKYDPSRI